MSLEEVIKNNKIVYGVEPKVTICKPTYNPSYQENFIVLNNINHNQILYFPFENSLMNIDFINDDEGEMGGIVFSSIIYVGDIIDSLIGVFPNILDYPLWLRLRRSLLFSEIEFNSINADSSLLELDNIAFEGDYKGTNETGTLDFENSDTIGIKSVADVQIPRTFYSDSDSVLLRCFLLEYDQNIQIW